jgi:hypothetical protein
MFRRCSGFFLSLFEVKHSKKMFSVILRQTVWLPFFILPVCDMIKKNSFFLLNEMCH